jgi:hypothetical protein
MATIYQQISQDKLLILDPREGFQRKFDVGSWSEIRIGFFYDSVGLNTPTSSTVDEVVTQVTRADILSIGLKDSATSILPGFSGSYFVGVAITGSHNMSANNTRYEDQTGGNMYGTGFYGTSSYYGAQTMNWMLYPTNGGASSGGSPSTSDYCGVYTIKMVLNNSGSSSQTISMYTANSQQVSTGTSYYSVGQLNQQMNNGTFGTVSTVTWNDGANAFPIPDSLWIRTPFYNNRLRIASLSLIRYS